MKRALLPLCTVVALLLGACGGDDDTADEATAPEAPLSSCNATIDDVTVSGDLGADPTIDLDGTIAVEQTQCQLLTEGEGDATEVGDLVLLDFVLVNGRTGDEYVATHPGATNPADPYLLVSEDLPRGIRQGIVGAKAKGRTLTVMSPEDGFALRGGDPAAGLETDDSLVFVADIHEVRHPLDKADGSAVEPITGLPTVTRDDTGKPTITIPSNVEPPTTLVAQSLIDGDGDAVQSGQRVLVQYTGVIYGSGQEFDSSWGRAPTIFPIGTGGVIKGWDDGLVGRTIGSSVLLVIPPELGYGAQGEASAGIAGTDTLVFVVDILDAW